jgi:DNA (cytosine-5)-methyltransferase 1
MSHMGNDHTVVSLFSGAGGMSLGFCQAGLKPAFAADIDKDACATYRGNLGIEITEFDLSKRNKSFIQMLDQFRGAFALIGGPPCQGFSSAGRKDGDDPRNALIFSYLDTVERIFPRWFIFENVEGLLTSNGGESIRDLVREFAKLGYRLRLEKVNFASFGLPQGRKRIVLIGNRLALDFRFPQNAYSFSSGKHKHFNHMPLAPSVDEALAGLGQASSDWGGSSAYSSPEPVNSYDQLMREGNKTESVSLHVSSVPKQLADICCKLRPGQTMRNLPSKYWHDSYKRRAFRRVMDGTPTEKRGGAPSGVKRLFGNLSALTITSAATREFVHPEHDRPLTIRECARLQSFPDAYEFSGNAGSVIRQIGNAFPPLAAKIFAEHLILMDGLHGADASSQPRKDSGGLIDFRLTDAKGMSPALARTAMLLDALTIKERVELPLGSAIAEVA